MTPQQFQIDSNIYSTQTRNKIAILTHTHTFMYLLFPHFPQKHLCNQYEDNFLAIEMPFLCCTKKLLQTLIIKSYHACFFFQPCSFPISLHIATMAGLQTKGRETHCLEKQNLREQWWRKRIVVRGLELRQEFTPKKRKRDHPQAH